jgi:integrase
MTLRETIDRYISWRHAHGAKFTTGANLLRRFLHHADGDAVCDAVTTGQVLAFLAGKGPLTRHRGNKYHALAGFWRHAISRGHATRSPMPGNEPRSPVRAPPYIYSREELRRLFDPATVEISRRGAVQLDAVTFRALLLLLYGAGLRFGEATRLTLADVDLANAVLTIRATKFYKSRLVPVGPQLAAVLANHARVPASARRARSRRKRFAAGEPGRNAARQQHRSGGVRHPAARRWGPSHNRWKRSPAPARSSSQLRGPSPDQLVSAGRRRAATTAGALHLSRPCRS